MPRRGPIYTLIKTRLQRYVENNPDTTWQQFQKQARWELNAYEQDGVWSTEEEGYTRVEMAGNRTTTDDFVDGVGFSQWLLEDPRFRWPAQIEQSALLELLKSPI